MIQNDSVIEIAMKKAINEAFTARAKGEDPFGAVLINGKGEICFSSHSTWILGPLYMINFTNSTNT